jgi:hypothetical protein
MPKHKTVIIKEKFRRNSNPKLRNYFFCEQAIAKEINEYRTGCQTG